MFIKKFKNVFVIFCILLVSLIFGCKENPIEKYGTGMIDSYKSTKKAKDEINLTTIKNSIERYRAVNGKYPEGIKEIEAFAGLTVDPALYDYNPETGELRLK